MLPQCVLFSRACALDRAAGGNADLDRCGRDRHAARLPWPECPSADGARAAAFIGHVFVFRGRRGDIVKVLWFDGDGLCLLAKRLERGRFVWPQA